MTLTPINFDQLDSWLQPQPAATPTPVAPAPAASAPTPFTAQPQVQTPAHPPTQTPAQPPSVVIAFRSLLGGAGKSLSAINFAFEAAALGKRVCLVDLDLHSPSLHRWFALPDANDSVAALARLIAQNRFEATSVEQVATTLQVKNAQVALLASAGGLGRPADPQSIEVLLEFLALRFDVVVLDTATGTDHALHQVCNRVATAQYLLVPADPIGLGRHLDAEVALAHPLPNCQVLPNAVRQSALGSRVEWQVSQTMQGRSQYPLAGLLPQDTATADHAMLAAVPLRQVSGKSPLLLQYRTLAANQLAPTRQSIKRGGLAKL